MQQGKQGKHTVSVGTDQGLAGHVPQALASIKRGFRIYRIVRQFDTLLVQDLRILPFTLILKTYVRTVKKAEPSLPHSLFDLKSSYVVAVAVAITATTTVTHRRVLLRPVYRQHLLTLRAPSEHSILLLQFDSTALRLSNLTTPIAVAIALPSSTRHSFFCALAQ